MLSRHYIFQPQKEPFRNLRITAGKAVVPTIVATLIFLMTYRVFGMENTMIAPFATLSFLRYRSMHNHYECMIKNYVVFILMAVLSYFAVMNPALCILINAAALFWIAYYLIDEYNPTNYFPAGMALIFFQIAPVSSTALLGNRILALLSTFVLIFVFVLVLSAFEKEKDPLSGYIRDGFQTCEAILNHVPADASENTRDIESLCSHLHDVNSQISGEIYSYNRATLRKNGRTNYYVHFILVFQVINYLARTWSELSHPQRAHNLYEHFRREFDTVSPEPVYQRLNFRITRPDIRSFRLRFALRQVITVTPCIVFAWASHLPNAYWLVISVFFMMIPFTDHTRQRVKQRVLGTIFGILICLILFSLFRGFTARVIIMTIANFLIYGANGYGPTVAYITCSALAIQTIDSAVTIVLLERLIYTLAGAVIALIANKYIFPIRIRYQIRYLTGLIEEIRKQLTDLTQNTAPGTAARRKQIDQRIVQCYLLFKRLEIMYQTAPAKIESFDYDKFEQEHMNFIAEYLSTYL